MLLDLNAKSLCPGCPPPPKHRLSTSLSRPLELCPGSKTPVTPRGTYGRRREGGIFRFWGGGGSEICSLSSRECACPRVFFRRCFHGPMHGSAIPTDLPTHFLLFFRTGVATGRYFTSCTRQRVRPLSFPFQELGHGATPWTVAARFSRLCYRLEAFHNTEAPARMESSGTK